MIHIHCSVSGDASNCFPLGARLYSEGQESNAIFTGNAVTPPQVIWVGGDSHRIAGLDVLPMISKVRGHPLEVDEKSSSLGGSGAASIADLCV